MNEVAKNFITVHDVKLVIAVVGVMVSGAFAWNQVEKDVSELQIRVEYDKEWTKRQITTMENLTKAVQNLNLTSVQLEARLKNLETAFPTLRRSIERNKG